MKHIAGIACWLGLLGAILLYNNYISYKRLQCIDHNIKGFSLRFVSVDPQERAQQLVNAKLNALTQSDYSFLFGCRFYENDKLTKFIYDYPMSDDVYFQDLDSTIERIKNNKWAMDNKVFKEYDIEKYEYKNACSFC